MKLSLGQTFKSCKQKVNGVVDCIKASKPVIGNFTPLKQLPPVQFVAKENNPVNSKIVSALTENISSLRELAANNGVTVKMTQLGNALMINTGAVTSYVEASKINNAKKLYNAVESNIILNRGPSSTLRHGFNV